MNDEILNQFDSDMLANSINHFKSIEHQEKLNYISLKQAMVFVKAYKLVPVKDGNQWCVLLGEDLQSGIAGYGGTPFEAIIDFNHNFMTAK